MDFFGCHKLLFFDPKNGTLLNSIQIPRIGKLFSPIRIDSEYEAFGYTNWSSAGILAYSMVSKKVKWKSGKKFDGPLLRCRIYKKDSYLYWVKNDREMVCLEENDGTDER